MSRYIRYQIKNTEPIRIADDNASQLGQISTLQYIPGTTMRGLVVNALAAGLSDEELNLLFSGKVRFLNAYMTAIEKDSNGKIVERELFPSPKGFYEDKEIKSGAKEIENVVVSGEVTPGNKRAALGRYSYFDGDTIHYYKVDCGSDLKIALGNHGEKRNVFRNEYIMPGYYFTGYIAIDDQGISEKIQSVLSGEIYLGNARSSGLGKCVVLECKESEQTPYETYAVKTDQSEKCYMMLLSHTVMRGEYGEVEGLNLPVLEKLMGVEELKISYCATSTVNVSGYNRTLKSRTPSVCAYEQGSVFCLEYKGIFTAEKANALMEKGIGIQKNEGFGRVLFLDHYEKIGKKVSGGEEGFIFCEKEDMKKVLPEKEDQEVLEQAAKNYYRKLLKKSMLSYVVKNQLDRKFIPNSQIGIVESLISANKYQPQKAVEVLERYFTHAEAKEERAKVHKNTASVQGFGKKILNILNRPFADTLEAKMPEKIFGFPTKELLSLDEELKIKMDFILMLIRYENKKEG